MLILNILWWLFFIISALFIQVFVPGIDALAPGLLISLQERRWQQSFWLAIIFMLIQEGTGSLSFGAAPLWYLAVTFLFLIGCRLFSGNNAFFVVLLSLALGCTHFLIVLLVTQIGAYTQSYEMLMFDSLAQAISFPLVWFPFSYIRKRCFKNASRS